MTFSLAGLCPRTRRFGCALATSSMAAGGRAPFVQPGVGSVLSQARSDPRLGALGLQALAAGRDAAQALSEMMASTPHAAWRQLAVLDLHGGTACFTGAQCTQAKGERQGEGVVVVGNGLANATVLDAMQEAFAATPDADLAERLVAALEAGERAGGEAFPLRSASLMVAHPELPFLPVNLRVDFSDEPIAELRRMLLAWLPMMDGYIMRCMDPERSPAAAAIEGHRA